MLGLCVGLMLVQFLAAVPWLLAWTWRTKLPPGERKRMAAGSAERPRPLTALGIALGATLGVGIILGVLYGGARERETLESYGKAYGSILQLQLQVDLLVFIFAAMHWLWPKGAAV